MISKELTEAEIIQAYYECYVQERNCIKCPLNAYAKKCVTHSHVYELILKQQKEIKALKSLVELQKSNINTTFENNMKLRNELKQLKGE